MNNYSYLYRSIYLPAITVLVLLTGAWMLYEEMEAQTNALEQSFQRKMTETNAIVNELTQLQQRVSLINSYYGRFQQAHQAGVFNDQSRVDWIDRLMELVAQHDIRHVSMQFSARSTLGATEIAPLNASHKFLLQEVVDFEGEVQHEGDWLAFVNALSDRVNHLVLLDDCHLSVLTPKDGNSAQPAYQAEQGNIAVKCRFRFLVYNLPKVSNRAGGKP